jgi:protein-disulfide isomerase
MAILRRLGEGGKASVVAGLIGLLIGAAAMAFATGRGAIWGSGDTDRAHIEKVVHAYLMEHPEVLPAAMKRLEERNVTRTIEAHRAGLETPFAGAWAGAEDGDVILVEFFDYACPFCHASNRDVARLLSEDKKLKVVWRDLPVLGEDSAAAARLSLAAAKQGKFRAFHDRLFAAGRPSAAARASAAQAAGVAPSDAREFEVEIDRNFELARALQVSGTPAFVVGNQFLQGSVGYDALKKAIAEARKSRV